MSWGCIHLGVTHEVEGEVVMLLQKDRLGVTLEVLEYGEREVLLGTNEEGGSAQEVSCLYYVGG